MEAFISHISEEAPIALVLKEWIDRVFLGQVNVFVSSDSDCLTPGVRWEDQIRSALGNAQVVITLASPASITRPWINIEAGGAWLKGTPIITVCHSGMSRGELPAPISAFQAMNMDDPDFGPEFFRAMARHLGFRRPPEIDNNAFRADIAENLGEIVMPDLSEQPAGQPVLNVVEDLTEKEVRLLKQLAQPSFSGHTEEKLSYDLQLSQQQVKYFLEQLECKDPDYVWVSYFVGRPAQYELGEKGRAYLFERGLL